jgi:membrane fusion protein, copper/silver efflux system
MSAIPLLLLIAGAFMAGSWYSPRGPVEPAIPGAREMLHHAEQQSDTPGSARDSGTQHDAAHAHATGAKADTAGSFSSMPPDTVSISRDRQQLIGVRITPVEKTSGSHSLRVFGRVAPDETRIYKLNAGVEGLIQEVSGVTTGSQVAKDQWLATFFTPEFLPPIQAYLFALKTLDRLNQGGTGNQADINSANGTIRQSMSNLRYLGMSRIQIEEIGRKRETTQSIEIRAPASGFVLARAASIGQKFEKGAEWYRIADLSRVWILADVFDNEARYVRPGARAQVSLPNQKRTLSARVSEVLPQFDPATRTFKVRLEVDNPDNMLRPDMFVDVELAIAFAPTIAVPAAAVLDSGLRKTVFVDRGEGLFEPRQVETGWQFGDRVEIVKGLAPGERIVVSGTFLLDSESRMMSAAAGSRASSSQTAPAERGDQDRAHTRAGQH